jgi:hypothetical protein
LTVRVLDADVVYTVHHRRFVNTQGWLLGSQKYGCWW